MVTTSAVPIVARAAGADPVARLVCRLLRRRLLLRLRLRRRLMRASSGEGTSVDCSSEKAAATGDCGRKRDVGCCGCWCCRRGRKRRAVRRAVRRRRVLRRPGLQGDALLRGGGARESSGGRTGWSAIGWRGGVLQCWRCRWRSARRARRCSAWRRCAASCALAMGRMCLASICLGLLMRSSLRPLYLQRRLRSLA